MRNFPSQLMLVIVVLTTVAVKNVAPVAQLNGMLDKWQWTNNSYYAPEVPHGKQTGFIYLLKVDRRNLLPTSLAVRSNATSTIFACKQSYNAIACQISPVLLRENNLPLSIN